MHKQPTELEVERLKKVYRGYEKSRRAAECWSPTNLGNQFIVRERQAVAKRLFEKHDFFPLADRMILDVGCGGGGELARLLEWGANPGNLYGVDLLPERIEAARARNPNIRFQVANAESLSFPDGAFDIVLLFTVLSSILDENMASRVANEAARVLRLGGAVLLYDFRYRNPYNPNTRPITKTDMLRYFPGFKAETKRVTLMPPAARRLGLLTPYLYPALGWMPFLRTHYIALLISPDSPDRSQFC